MNWRKKRRLNWKWTNQILPNWVVDFYSEHTAFFDLNVMKNYTKRILKSSKKLNFQLWIIIKYLIILFYSPMTLQALPKELIQILPSRYNFHHHVPSNNRQHQNFWSHLHVPSNNHQYQNVFRPTNFLKQHHGLPSHWLLASKQSPIISKYSRKGNLLKRTKGMFQRSIKVNQERKRRINKTKNDLLIFLKNDHFW